MHYIRNARAAIAAPSTQEDEEQPAQHAPVFRGPAEAL